MSQAATKWAWAQRLPAPEKLLLLAIANHANHSGESWPCAKQLRDVTGLNINTVERKIVSLRERGLIFDTGKRTGTTAQVIVYRVGKLPQKQGALTPPIAKGLSTKRTPPKTRDGIGSKHRQQTAPIHEGEIVQRLRVVSGGAK